MKTKTNAGVSLIIAIVFVSAFMLVLAGLTEVQIRVIRSVGNRESEGKARYLAQSAAEMASFVAANRGVGGNIADMDANTLATLKADLYAAARDIGITSCDEENPCMGIDIVGRPIDTATVALTTNGALTNYYSVPSAGTGSAAEECVNEALADDPCHWNKLSYGESVEIPLYYEEMVNGTPQVRKPNFTQFKVRVRAPCGALEEQQDGTFRCSEFDNMTLFPPIGSAKYRDLDADPVVVQWTISDAGGDATMVAATVTEAYERECGVEIGDSRDPNKRCKPMINDRKDGSKSNTEISAGRINAAGKPAPNYTLQDFVVLDKTHNGNDLSQTDMWQANRPISAFLSEREKPVLRLSFVSRAKKNKNERGMDFIYPQNLQNNNPAQNSFKDGSFNVSNLEYQILMTGTGADGAASPIADSKSYILGWAKVGDFYREVKKYRNLPTSLGGFVLESF